MLIVLGFGLDLLDLVDSIPDNFGIMLFLLLLYPWACLLLKRLRIGEKPKWWAAVYILLYTVTQLVVFFGVLAVFSGGIFEIFADSFNEKISEAELDTYVDEMIENIIIPLAFASVFLKLVIVWLIDKFTPEVTDETIGEIFS